MERTWVNSAIDNHWAIYDCKDRRMLHFSNGMPFVRRSRIDLLRAAFAVGLHAELIHKLTSNGDTIVSKSILAVALIALTLPTAAGAQGLVRGAEQGAAAGRATGGPIGEIVGGAIGAATGTVNGILGVDDRPRFRTYVQGERR